MTLRRRILYSIGPVLILLVLVTLISFYSFYLYRQQQSRLNKDAIQLDQIVNQYQSIQQHLIGYLTLKEFSHLNDFLQESQNLRSSLVPLKQITLHSQTALTRKNLVNLLLTYLDLADQAVAAKRNRSIEAYNLHFNDALEVSSYLSQFIAAYSLELSARRTSRLELLSSKVSLLQTGHALVILLLAGIAGLILSSRAQLLAIPIEDITEQASRIAAGDLEGNQEQSDYSFAKEIERLHTAFNGMRHKLRERIAIEEALRTEELRIVKVRETLLRAEFSAFQSQINPHFIFNTLNAGIQLAMFEEAQRTQDYLELFSDSFRYALRNATEPVRIEEECNYIENYLGMMRIRFGDNFRFRVEIPDQVLGFLIPRMSFQPIVENSFVHALSLVDQLHIKISAIERNDRIELRFSDNGPSFPPEASRRIEEFSRLPLDQLPLTETAHIGLANLIFRLRLFFEGDCTISLPAADSDCAILIDIPAWSQHA